MRLLKEFKFHKLFAAFFFLSVLFLLSPKEANACPIGSVTISVAGCTASGVTVNIDVENGWEGAVGWGLNYAVTAVDGSAQIGQVSGTTEYTCGLSFGENKHLTVTVPFSREPTVGVVVSVLASSPGIVGPYIGSDSHALPLAACVPLKSPNGTACGSAGECQSNYCNNGICDCVPDGVNTEPIGASCSSCCAGSCQTGTRRCVDRGDACADVGQECGTYVGNKPCCQTGSVECRHLYSAPGGNICTRKTAGTCKSWGSICNSAGDTTCCADFMGDAVNCVSTGPSRYQCGGDSFDWGVPPPIEYTGPILSIKQIINIIYTLLFPIGVAFGGFMIIKAGYTIMTSEGNPQKVAEAKEDLTAAVIGLLFVLLSAVILRVIISSLLGADI